MNQSYPLDSASEELRRELFDGEQLVWTGQPRRGIHLRARDAFMIPFSLMWGGFAFFWEFSVIRSGAPVLFAIWGVPFVLVGIYLIVGRFFYDAAARARTAYALTNRRAIIISGIFSRQIRSIDLRSIPELGFRESSDGSGTISFGAPESPMSSRSGSRNICPQFEFIENARPIFEKARGIHLMSKESR